VTLVCLERWGLTVTITKPLKVDAGLSNGIVAVVAAAVVVVVVVAVVVVVVVVLLL